jgi:D-alanyl-lipoteichoic acid acyltransferase DltB (MBOAT superfamily)
MMTFIVNGLIVFCVYMATAGADAGAYRIMVALMVFEWVCAITVFVAGLCGHRDKSIKRKSVKRAISSIVSISIAVWLLYIGWVGFAALWFGEWLLGRMALALIEEGGE